MVILASTSRVEGLELLAYSGFGFPMRKRWAEYIGFIGLLTPLLEDAVQLYMVVAASTKLDEWTTMAQVNLCFTIVSMLYAVINKVIQKLSKGGVDDEEAMDQTDNPLSDEDFEKLAETKAELRQMLVGRLLRGARHRAAGDAGPGGGDVLR